jgi:hypothetical protein
VDNIPPAPVTYLRALDTPDDAGGSITFTWDLSADDQVVMSSFGDFVVPRGGLRGYRIYRMDADSGAEVLLATVGPGTSSYVDQRAQKGVTYAYAVRPFDADNEADFSARPSSAEDLARIATAIDNTYVPPPPVVAPVGRDGLPVVGWFSRQGDRVGFEDFFLFADHFGLKAGDFSFDPLFDLVPNGGSTSTISSSSPTISARPSPTRARCGRAWGCEQARVSGGGADSLRLEVEAAPLSFLRPQVHPCLGVW